MELANTRGKDKRVARELFIIIPVHNRIDMLVELLDELDFDPQHVILVDNNSSPALLDIPGLFERAVIEPFTVRNIQAMWNRGWQMATERATGPYAVGIFNSDLMISKAGVIKLAEELDRQNASVTYPDQVGLVDGQFIREHRPGPYDRNTRLTGWCFMARGELETRFDESMVWWYGDDDFEWRARQEFGGCVMVGGVQARNRDADGAQRVYPELVTQCTIDWHTFVYKWGVDSFSWMVYNQETLDRMIWSKIQ